MAVITFTTDFGLQDWFAGTMKGIVLSIHPRASIVDITHQIAPGDIRAGAFALLQAARFFPPKTIHVAIIDPGVGSDRNAIVIQTHQALFVGPDNGVLSFAVRQQPILSVRRLANARLFQHPVSRTFHGRDIFAPVAARLARGLPLAQVGPPLPNFVRLDWPEPGNPDGVVRGQVLYLDRYGNAITNLDAAALASSLATPATITIRVGRHRRIPLAESYSAVEHGRPLALLGSSGLLEIAVNGGSAAVQLGLHIGSDVTVHSGVSGATRK
jgi:S-adenosyl-L-methionine hydrolase (adenosine-forming)